MGCSCSKGIEGENVVRGRKNKSLKRLVASSEKEDTVVTDVSLRSSRESTDGGRERLTPEAKENGINLDPLLLGNGIVKSETTFSKIKKAVVQERWDSREGREEQVELVLVGGDTGDEQHKHQNLVILSVTYGTIAEHGRTS